MDHAKRWVTWKGPVFNIHDECLFLDDFYLLFTYEKIFWLDSIEQQFHAIWRFSRIGLLQIRIATPFTSWWMLSMDKIMLIHYCDPLYNGAKSKYAKVDHRKSYANVHDGLRRICFNELNDMCGGINTKVKFFIIHRCRHAKNQIFSLQKVDLRAIFTLEDVQPKRPFVQ